MEIGQRSGFYDLLKLKLETGELVTGDAVMAMKGFVIRNELDKVRMKLDIPPFFFGGGGGATTAEQRGWFGNATNQHHRILVQRAIPIYSTDNSF